MEVHLKQPLASPNCLKRQKPLLVIAVMHGNRSPRVMAAILRAREENQ